MPTMFAVIAAESGSRGASAGSGAFHGPVAEKGTVDTVAPEVEELATAVAPGVDPAEAAPAEATGDDALSVDVDDADDGDGARLDGDDDEGAEIGDEGEDAGGLGFRGCG